MVERRLAKHQIIDARVRRERRVREKGTYIRRVETIGGRAGGGGGELAERRRCSSGTSLQAEKGRGTDKPQS